MKMNYWNEKEIILLQENYGILDKEELFALFPGRSWSSILSQANKKNLHKRNSWTPKEDELLKSIYPNIPVKEVCTIISNRTYDGIIHRAQKLKLNSYDHPIWTDEQKQYLISHWEQYPDVIIAQNINKTKNAVKRMRNLLGFHRQNKDQRTYENISKYIRGNIYDWKKESMESCGFKCVITGSKIFDIHHLYPVNKMINNIFETNNIAWKSFTEYTQEELDLIMSLFIDEQSKHPLGVCVDKNIHMLFHHLYGQYNTTEAQWNQFKEDYINGLYKDIVA